MVGIFGLQRFVTARQRIDEPRQLAFGAHVVRGDECFAGGGERVRERRDVFLAYPPDHDGDPHEFANVGGDGSRRHGDDKRLRLARGQRAVHRRSDAVVARTFVHDYDDVVGNRRSGINCVGQHSEVRALATADDNVKITLVVVCGYAVKTRARFFHEHLLGSEDDGHTATREHRRDEHGGESFTRAGVRLEDGAGVALNEAFQEHRRERDLVPVKAVARVV